MYKKEESVIKKILPFGSEVKCEEWTKADKTIYLCTYQFRFFEANFEKSRVVDKPEHQLICGNNAVISKKVFGASCSDALYTNQGSISINYRPKFLGFK